MKICLYLKECIPTFEFYAAIFCLTEDKWRLLHDVLSLI